VVEESTQAKDMTFKANDLQEKQGQGFGTNPKRNSRAKPRTSSSHYHSDSY